MKKIFLILFAIGLFLSPTFTLAQTMSQNICDGFVGCKIVDGQEVCCLDNPLAGNKTEATAMISTVIRGALGIIGALTLLMLVWGGFQWLTAAGSEEKVHMGTQTMVWAIIGVFLVFASYILLSTFTSYLAPGS